MASLVNSTTHLQKTSINPFQTFPKTEEERTLSNLFYEASITLIANPDRYDKKIKDRFSL